VAQAIDEIASFYSAHPTTPLNRVSTTLLRYKIKQLPGEVKGLLTSGEFTTS